MATLQREIIEFLDDGPWCQADWPGKEVEIILIDANCSIPHLAPEHFGRDMIDPATLLDGENHHGRRLGGYYQPAGTAENGN